MTVIPDSIEPYIGYKALRITPEGMLTSPQQTDFIWPVGKRAAAECGRGSYRWVAREGQSPYPTLWDQIEAKSFQLSSSGVNSTAAVVFPNTNVTFRPPAPQGFLPEGCHWSWEWESHPAGMETCSCGIYVVEERDRTFDYCGIDTVVCAIAVWGQVTVAHKGARGQYAYPQLMYVPKHLCDVAPLVAERYGIETVPQDFKTGREPRRVQTGMDQLKEIDKREETFLACRDDARKASIGFACVSIPFYAVTLVLYLSKTGSVQWAAIAPFIFAMLATVVALAARADSRKKFDPKGD